MKSNALHQMSIEEATEKQFKLIDEITKEFNGTSFSTLGDLGINLVQKSPVYTRKIERIIASFFSQEDSVFVRGAGTGAIRFALSSVLMKENDVLLLHKAPIYPTTKDTIEIQKIKTVMCDFNCKQELIDRLTSNKNIKCVLIQHSRQTLSDYYELGDVINTIKNHSIARIITDDNYATLKVKSIGTELGADLSTFSCFKLLGPEGIGMVVGKSELINQIRKFQYSGGSQTQGHEAMAALRGLVYTPVIQAIQSNVIEKCAQIINNGKICCVEKAVVANAQSKVILIKFNKPIAMKVLEEAEKLGATPYPVGAESKYELLPMFYRVSGTMRVDNPEYSTHWIRINPMRSGPQTVIRILEEAVRKVIECF
ncbi:MULTISPECIES: aminotransferase class V-fold PLP-dependent enzyme [Terrabacteria group]|uniref:aminotransferase class V-fold PLP-dependent enzyme n=1 Tax=Bacillati TaxID=1783272 RepID=UPI001C6F4C4D|nr:MULTISPECIES: aminotransferase class V-fold PLP-dependent enzyme [Terrabacteria group]MBW9212987.1 cysteine desulfurase [Trueperella sp. zg.1013]